MSSTSEDLTGVYHGRLWTGQVRIAPELRDALIRAAAEDRRSLANWATMAVEKELRRRRFISPEPLTEVVQATAGGAA